jgi:hypothetical protein
MDEWMAQVGNVWSASFPVCFSPWERAPGTQRIHWVGLQLVWTSGEGKCLLPIHNICPTNALYSNVFTLEHIQYLYISCTCFNHMGSSSGTHLKLKIKSYKDSINSICYKIRNSQLTWSSTCVGSLFLLCIWSWVFLAESRDSRVSTFCQKRDVQ